MVSDTRNIIHIIFLTLLSCTIFGILEIFIMWAADVYIVPTIKHHYHQSFSSTRYNLDISHLNLLVGAIVASLTIGITTSIEEHLRDKFSIIHTPVFRILGIIVASVFWFCILNFTLLFYH